MNRRQGSSRIEYFKLGSWTMAEVDTDSDGILNTAYRYGRLHEVTATERIQSRQWRRRMNLTFLQADVLWPPLKSNVRRQNMNAWLLTWEGKPGRLLIRIGG